MREAFFIPITKVGRARNGEFMLFLAFWDRSTVEVDATSAPDITTEEEEVGQYAIVSKEAGLDDAPDRDGGPSEPKAGPTVPIWSLVIVVGILVLIALTAYYVGVSDKDTDGDGVADNEDAFPNNASEWKDSDDDTYGNNIDAFPQDPDEWEDADGDGTGNNADTDDDNDGVPDEVDEFPLVDASIEITLILFTLLDQVDEDEKDETDPNGSQVWIVIHVLDGGEPIRVPVSGNHIMSVGDVWEINQTFTVNIPDNRTSWDIEINCWDDDSRGANDQIDISPTTDRTLRVNLDLITGTWTGDVSGCSSSGEDDGSGDTDDDDGAIEFSMVVVFD